MTLTEPPRPARGAYLLNAYGGYKQARRRRFEQTAADGLTPWTPPAAISADAGYMESERVRPARAPEVEADFVVPILQGVGVGVFALVISAYFVALYDAVWHLSCIIAFIAAGGWYLAAMIAGRATLWITETIITGAPDEPPPSPAPPALSAPPVQLEVVQRDDRGRLTSVQRFGELPADLQERLPAFAAGVLAGRGLTVNSWTGKGGAFSRQEFETLMDALGSAGIVRWVNPQDRRQGRELTLAGRAALRQIAALDDKASPANFA